MNRGVVLVENSFRLFKQVACIWLIILFGVMAISCGGVQSGRNPATPPFGGDKPGEELPGKGTELPDGEGQETQAEAQAWGKGKILEGDYDTLIARAESSLQTGDLEDSYNAYYSALAQKPDDAQSGFGMVLCRIAMNWRTFAVFTGAGVDKLYYGTPLVMHPELLPNPISADDSYLLRLFTIGRRYEENFSVKLPSWATDFRKKESGQGPEGSPGVGEVPETGPVVPQVPIPGGGIIAPPGDEGEGEEDIEEEEPSDEGEGEGEEQPPGEEPEGEEEPPGDEEPEGEEPEGEEPEDEEPEDEEPEGDQESSSKWPSNWEPLAAGGDDQKDDPFGTGMNDDDMEEKLKEIKDSEEFPSMPGMPPEVPSQLQPGETPIDADYFSENIPLTRTELDKEAAGIRMDYQLINNITNMNTNLKDLISSLEDISGEINQDFVFQAGLVLRGKTERYDMVFRENDFELMLAELKILAGITGFVTAYSTENGFMYYYNQPEDFNSNGLFTPDEYYPLQPFGSLIEETGTDILSEAEEYYIDGLEDAAGTWELVLERAFNSGVETENEMLAVASGGVEAAVLDDYKKIYRDFAARFYDSLDVNLDSMGNMIEVKINPSKLFDGSITEVRVLLPCLDASGTMVPCDEASELWPDNTFAGLFPDGLEDDATVKRSGKISGEVSDDSLTLMDEGKISYLGGQSEISKEGTFLLSGVEFNELIGLSVAVSSGEGIPWEGVVHSMMENISTLMLMQRAPGESGMNGMPMPGSGIGHPLPDGDGGTGTFIDGIGPATSPG